jgi:hypothetical protein
MKSASEIRAKLDAILHSKDLGNTQKQDQLRLLIPAGVFKIEDLTHATPDQLSKLQDAIDVAQSIQRIESTDG